MPKILDYPKSSFANSMNMATAIDALGGSCEKESCADQMGLKLTGAFSKRISAAVKYNLITSTKGRLAITDLYKSIKNAYDDDEEQLRKKEAFLTPPVYNSLYETFKGKKLPVNILDKYLIREFGVEDKNASTVANIFLKDLKSIGLIENELIIDIENGAEVEEIDEVITEEDVQDDLMPVKPSYNPKYADSNRPSQILHIENKNKEGKIERNPNEFVVHIIGPGMDSEIVVKEEEDMLIVEAMLKKVKKKL